MYILEGSCAPRPGLEPAAMGVHPDERYFGRIGVSPEAPIRCAARCSAVGLAHHPRPLEIKNLRNRGRFDVHMARDSPARLSLDLRRSDVFAPASACAQVTRNVAMDHRNRR